MKKSKKITALMAALSVFGLTGCDLGSISDSIKNFDVWNLVDPLHWFHDKKDKDQDQDKDDDKDVAVTSVVVTPSTLSLKEGESRLLSVEVLPSNATNKTVTWTSSNPEVATVSNGNVVAVKEGTATIKATAGGKEGQCVVTVTKNGDTPPVPVEITEIVSVNGPTQLEQDSVVNKADFTLTVKYSDGTTHTANPDRIELSTAVVGDAIQGTAYINQLSKTFMIKIVAKEVPPVIDTITPQKAIELMDAAGESVVVTGLQKVKGICAANTKYDTQYKQYTTGFEGVDNFKVQFTDTNNILNGASPDGMEIVVEGYLEKYKGKYQLSYLPESASPTGEKFTPNLVSAAAPVHEGVLDEITVSTAHREFYKGSTFVEETVTAHYSDGATATVKATFSGYDMNTLGEQTVTVSYTEKGVTKQTTYTINVIERGSGHAGTLEDPLTTAEAATIANGLAETTDSKKPIASEGMYVKGVVTEFKETFSADFGNYSVVIGGDFTLWRIKNGPDFAKFNEGDIEVGDEVIAFVYIMNYKGTPESTSNSYVHGVQKAGDTKTLQSIEIVGSLTKTSYVEGQAYSSAGLSVKGHYDDGSEGIVAATIILNKTTAVYGDTEIIASATFKEITAEPKTFTVTVTEKSPVAEGDFYKVKSQDEITEGQYLLVYEASETEAKVFNGIDVATKDGASAVDAAIEIDHIAANDSFVKVALETMDGGFALKVVGGTNDGKYMCGASGSNTTKFETTKQLNTITHSETGDSIVSNTSTIMYNKASDQARFRYYKEGTTSQQPVHLYKMKDGGTPTPVKELSSISIEGALTKTEYTVGETYSTEGLSVKGHYDDGTEGVVPASIILNKTTATLGDTEIIASAEYNGKTAEPKTFTISVAEGQVKNYGTEQAPLTVSQALALITEECTEDKAMTAQAITVQGQITEVKNKYVYDNVPCFEFNISDGTSTVYVYRCHCTDQQATGVVVGATVKLVGYAKNFKGTLEFVDNGTSQCHILAVESNVPDKELSSISIEGALTKTTYTEGEAYSTEGLSVVGHYSDGSSADVSATIALNKQTAAVGDTQIVASAEFNGKTATKDLAVTVNAKKIVTGITFSEEHRTFDQYAEFVKETVTATFTIGDPEIVEATFTTPDMTTAGEKTITVSYTDAYGTTVNNSYTITVVGAPEPELTGITIEGELVKTAYTVGETYSAAGLSVVAHYDNGANNTVEATIALSKTVATEGDTSITASATYEGKNASKDFVVTVVKEAVINSVTISKEADFAGGSYAANNLERFTTDGSGLAIESYQANLQGESLQLQSGAGKIWTTSPINGGIKKIELETTSTVLKVYVGNTLCPTSENGLELIGANGVYTVTTGTYKYMSIINGDATTQITSDIVISYEGTIGEYTIPAHDIQVSDAKVELTPDGTKNVVATVQPSTASDKSVKWSVKNASPAGCVTVSQDGTITAVAVGTATVVVSSVANPEILKEIAVTVSSSVVKAEAEYLFETAASDGSNALDDNVLAEFGKGLTSTTNIVTAASSTKVYKGVNGLKFGSSSAKGTLTMTTNVAIKKIVIKAIVYGTDNSVILVNGKEVKPTATLSDYEIQLDAATTSITIEAKNASKCRFYIAGMSMFK